MNVDNLKDFDEMKEELNSFKEELKKEHQKQTPPNLIKYKFFATNKRIPWRLGGENIKPTPDIQDSYFNFIQLPDNTQFNFNTPFIADIVVNDDSLTYWKVERYKNNVKDRDFYFKTSRVLKYAKNAFQLELELDVYLTYSRNIINSIKNTNKLIKVNRGLITSGMITDSSNQYQTAYLKALKNIDSVVLNGDDSYWRIRTFRFLGAQSGSFGNTYPIETSGAIKDGKSFNIFKFPNYVAPLLFKPQLDGTGGYGSVQKYISGGATIKYAKKWFGLQNPTTPRYLLSEQEQKDISKYINQFYAIKSLSSGDGYTDWDEANKNLRNSYFAVFRNIEGTIDCYPLIGKLKAKYQVPVICDDTAKIPTESENKQINYSTIYTGRFYVGYDTFIDGELNNDWDSIYNDFIKNVPAWYTNKSYIGIYRGIIPTGIGENKIHIEVKETDYQRANFDVLGRGETKQYRFAKPNRIFLRLNYEDVINVNISNDIDGNTVKPFLLASNDTNLIENYVKLLQPICFGSTEIIPARYSFLAPTANNTTEFTIPFLGSFLDGFYLFLKSSTYNGAVYGLTLGGTLPTKTESYQQQLDIINQQKNAGVAAAVGNIVARPLNWLTGSFGSTKGLSQSTGLSTSIGDYFDSEIASEVNRSVDNWDKIRGYRLGIGGLGGFIGDGINIWNTIKQSELAKRNIGIGYLTSTSDDMLSAIVQNSFLYNTSLKPLDSGIFSIGFIKEFDRATLDKYINYYHLYGFSINELIPANYINNVINYVKNENRIGFFQLDRDWCLINLDELADFNDDVVRNAIVADLSSGIRMKKYS